MPTQILIIRRIASVLDRLSQWHLATNASHSLSSPGGQQPVQLCLPERPGLVAEVRAAIDAGEQASAPPA
jgi:hypothetical protein